MTWAAWMTTEEDGLVTWAEWITSEEDGLVTWAAWMTSEEDGLATWAEWMTSEEDGLVTWAAWMTSEEDGLVTWAAWMTSEEDGLVTWATWMTSEEDGLVTWAAWMTSEDGLVTWAAWMMSEEEAPETSTSRVSSSTETDLHTLAATAPVVSIQDELHTPQSTIQLITAHTATQLKFANIGKVEVWNENKQPKGHSNLFNVIQLVDCVCGVAWKIKHSNNDIFRAVTFN